MADQTFTVVGAWIDDEPLSVAVIAGDHPVLGGGDDFEQGCWAVPVTAPDAEYAAAAAEDLMMGTLA